MGCAPRQGYGAIQPSMTVGATLPDRGTGWLLIEREPRNRCRTTGSSKGAYDVSHIVEETEFIYISPVIYICSTLYVRPDTDSVPEGATTQEPALGR